MNRTFQLGLSMTVAGVCCVVAATVSAFYYTRYRLTETRLERALLDLESRVARMEANRPREVVRIHTRGILSTADHPFDPSALENQEPAGSAGHRLFQPPAKTGPVIGPEFRIPAGATNQVFEIAVDPGYGQVVDAWVSRVSPFDQSVSFTEFSFRVGHSRENTLRLTVAPKPGLSARVQFEVVVLVERRTQ